MRSFKLPLKLWPISAGYLSEGGVKTPTIPTCKWPKWYPDSYRKVSEHSGVGGWIRPPTSQLF
jgi:hypothetical protein